jgi:phosphoribosylformylglycinamidine synthase
MKARVLVTPKKTVLDPQGVAVKEAVQHMGAQEVSSVRVGKVIELEIDGQPNEDKLHQICRDILSNPVIEDYEIQMLD